MLYSTFKDMVLYSTKSGSPMIMSQEPLLVLYSTIFFRVYGENEWGFYFQNRLLRSILKQL